MTLLFVYGTLLYKVDSRMANFLKDNGRHLGSAYINGRLYEIDGYPGVVVSDKSGEKVIGNIFAIEDEETVFTELDKYEEVGPTFAQPNEYKREKLEAFMNDGQKVRCWVYTYNHSVDKLRQIASGDYWSYVNKSN
ncbi:gamma-glutamylcyclotransferase family protein [Carboxylicivirga caseinilyticus]|uniref:gamma-glutamylcyclotransferase family protein n=1 Tax=Carboxylicivirga caseinilyticus TaxID=3417572 RepID=UPI003D3264A2|nr:gamma-glutamylcyclotransferase [Marinilabiliaceae bacterium A049]